MNFDKFIEFEKKMSLFSLSFQDVYFWKLIRLDIFIEAMKQDLDSGSVPRSQKKDFVNILLLIVKNLSTIKYSFYNKRTGSEIMVMNSFFYYIDQEEGKTNRILNHIFERNVHCTIINKASEIAGNNYEYYSHGRQNHIYFDSFRLIKYAILNPIIEFRMRKFNYLKHIESTINHQFGLNINLSELVKKHISAFKIDEKRAYRYFKKFKPKILYLVCAYGQEAIIHAAQRNDVNVIELQHGLLGQHTPGYHFPNEQYIPYFPNQLLLMGHYWSNQANFPNNVKVYVEPIPYYKNNIKKVRESRKHNFAYDIAFFFGDNVPVDIILEVSKKNPMLKFALKPHPNNLDSQELQKISGLNNLFLAMKDIDIYDIFISSKCVVTISSTIMYEAISCGVPVIVLKTQDYLVNQDFIERYNIQLVDFNPESIVKNIPTNPFVPFANGLFN